MCANAWPLTVPLPPLWRRDRRQHESLSHMSFVKELSRLAETDSNVHRLLARMGELEAVRLLSRPDSMPPPPPVCPTPPPPPQVVTEATLEERRNARQRGASTRQRSLGARIAAALEDEGTACVSPCSGHPSGPGERGQWAWLTPPRGVDRYTGAAGAHSLSLRRAGRSSACGRRPPWHRGRSQCEERVCPSEVQAQCLPPRFPPPPGP